MKNFVFVLLFMFVLTVPNLVAQTGGGNVVNGKAVKLIKPEYPQEAKAVGAEGTVNVQVTIDEEGNVSSAKAVSGHPLLRKSCEDAALVSKFEPTILSGQAVKVTGVVVYNFVAEKGNAIVEDKVVASRRIINGKAISLPKPKYPAPAKAVKAEGSVMIEVIVNEQGDVISANAVSGHALLRKESEKAALKAKFVPTKMKGKAVKFKGILVYNFAIN